MPCLREVEFVTVLGHATTGPHGRIDKVFELLNDCNPGRPLILPSVEEPQLKSVGECGRR